jgi:hypothetical protein
MRAIAPPSGALIGAHAPANIFRTRRQSGRRAVRLRPRVRKTFRDGLARFCGAIQRFHSSETAVRRHPVLPEDWRWRRLFARQNHPSQRGRARLGQVLALRIRSGWLLLLFGVAPVSHRWTAKRECRARCRPRAARAVPAKVSCGRFADVFFPRFADCSRSERREWRFERWSFRSWGRVARRRGWGRCVEFPW